MKTGTDRNNPIRTDETPPFVRPIPRKGATPQCDFRSKQPVTSNSTTKKGHQSGAEERRHVAVRQTVVHPPSPNKKLPARKSIVTRHSVVGTTTTSVRSIEKKSIRPRPMSNKTIELFKREGFILIDTNEDSNCGFQSFFFFTQQDENTHSRDRVLYHPIRRYLAGHLEIYEFHQ